MQSINNIPNDYRLTRYFAPLYQRYSVKALPTKVSCDRSLCKMLSIVNEKAGLFSLKCESEFALPPIYKPTKQSKKVFVAFSGGKDCLATAIRAEQDGYKPVLVYVRGINKSLPSERKHAFNLAQRVGYPIVEIAISISGNKEYNEHPLKNILILCLLIDEGIKNGVTTFGLGNLFEENSEHGSLDYDLSDSYDLIKAFNGFARKLIPNYKFLTYMHDNVQSFYTIYKHNPKLINYISTCITPDYRKPMLHKANVAKFGVGCILEDCCGSCYKCADIYLYRRAFGLAPHRIDYVKKCYEVKRGFDMNYMKDFKYSKGRLNRWGGYNTTAVQVLADRCGYYIGRLAYDAKLGKYFVNDCYGSKHYQDREIAEQVCLRFKQMYKL